MSVTLRQESATGATTAARALTYAELDNNFKYFLDANASLAGSTGASMVGFVQSGTGAGSRSVQSKEQDILSVLDFYANGVSGAMVDNTGVVESSGGIQAALAVAASTGKRVYAPGGTYKIGTTLTTHSAITLEGDGPQDTIFNYTGNAQFFWIKSDSTDVTLRNFGFNNIGTGTVGIQIDGYHALLENLRSSPTVKWSTATVDTLSTAIADVCLRSCRFYSTNNSQVVPILVRFQSGNGFQLDQCYLSGSSTANVVVGVSGQTVAGFSMRGGTCEIFDGTGNGFPGTTTSVGVALDYVNNPVISGVKFDSNPTGAGSAGMRNITTRNVKGGLISAWFMGGGWMTAGIECLSTNTFGLLIAGSYAERYVASGYLVLFTAAGNIYEGIGNGWDSTNCSGIIPPSTASAVPPFPQGLAMKSAQFQMFFVEIANVGGTIKHRIASDRTLGTLPTWCNKINGASITQTTTPTGADGSTAFATGVKISSASALRLYFDTPDQTPVADVIMQTTVVFNSTATPYVVESSFNSININGTTRTRLNLLLNNVTTGALVNWDTVAIPAGTSIVVCCFGMLL